MNNKRQYRCRSVINATADFLKANVLLKTILCKPQRNWSNEKKSTMKENLELRSLYTNPFGYFFSVFIV